MAATIIPFPPLAADLAADLARQRLARALALLNEALAAQREAIGAWRQSLGEFRAVTGELGQSLGAYQTTLGDVAGKVSALNQQARTLEQWASQHTA